MSRRAEFEKKLPLPGLAFLDGAKIVNPKPRSTRPCTPPIACSAIDAVQATHAGGAAHTLDDLRAMDMVGGCNIARLAL
jgi:hypothetical protein